MLAASWLSHFTKLALPKIGYIPDAWVGYLFATLLAVSFALVLHYLFYSIGYRIARRTPGVFDDSALKHSIRPTRVLLPLLAAILVVRASSIPREFIGIISHALGLAIIACIGWLLIDLLNVLRDMAAKRYDITLSDNESARRMYTQISVLQRVMVVVIVVLTIAFMLMTFEPVRHFGETVAASAGLIGIVGGLAARSTISGLIAGVQIAVTQPIRLDDVVIVEGEWGRIEEITTTFVVVRIWDLRRMIVPLTYFIEKPFQNWTRRSSDIMGTVFLYVDYSVPVDEIRRELERIVKASGLWDGKVCVLQVTSTSDRAMELRCLMSSSDSGKNFDLRCLVREQLIAYLQKNHPDKMPRVRAELTRANGAELKPPGI